MASLSGGGTGCGTSTIVPVSSGRLSIRDTLLILRSIVAQWEAEHPDNSTIHLFSISDGTYRFLFILFQSTGYLVTCTFQYVYTIYPNSLLCVKYLELLNILFINMFFLILLISYFFLENFYIKVSFLFFLSSSSHG